jgi:hypothetical protein
MKKATIVFIFTLLLSSCGTGSKTKFEPVQANIPAGITDYPFAVDLVRQYESTVNESKRLTVKMMNIAGVQSDDELSVETDDLSWWGMIRMMYYAPKLVRQDEKFAELDQAIEGCKEVMTESAFIALQQTILSLDAEMGRFKNHNPGEIALSSENDSLPELTYQQEPGYIEEEHQDLSSTNFFGSIIWTILFVVLVVGFIIYSFIRKVKKFFGGQLVQGLSHQASQMASNIEKIPFDQLVNSPEASEDDKKSLAMAQGYLNKLSGKNGGELEQPTDQTGEDLPEGVVVPFADLRDLYERELNSSVSSMEKLRKSVRNWMVLTTVTAAIALGIFSSGESQSVVNLIIRIVALIAAIVFLVRTTISFFKYRSKFKEEVVSKVIKLINPNFIYNPNKHIELSDVSKSKLVSSKANSCKGDDYVCGKLDKTVFEFSELVAQYKWEDTDDDGKKVTRSEDLFNGLFFFADFNKHISGETFVVPDRAEKMLGKMGQAFQTSRKGELVKLENPEFEKLFAVFSTDQVEARYVLSPVMMEAMVNIRRKVNHNFYFSFIGERVYCGIDIRKPLFEPRIFKPVSFDDVVFMHSLFELIQVIITEMNLNRRIWTKE